MIWAIPRCYQLISFRIRAVHGSPFNAILTTSIQSVGAVASLMNATMWKKIVSEVWWCGILRVEPVCDEAIYTASPDLAIWRWRMSCKLGDVVKESQNTKSETALTVKFVYIRSLEHKKGEHSLLVTTAWYRCRVKKGVRLIDFY